MIKTDLFMSEDEFSAREKYMFNFDQSNDFCISQIEDTFLQNGAQM